ncbi:trypsin-like serine protease [Saccharothrix sp. AJ9571]|nr:trypsin-like serine protease [Saccharothrix sp. AJ9571]
MQKIVKALYTRVATRDYRKRLAQLPVQPLVADVDTPPWVVSVNYRAEDHGRPDHATAVGTLISDRHVLTAGHVFHDTNLPGDPPEDAKKYFVRAGGRLADSGHTVTVKAVHQHPEFDMGSLGDINDIAILELDGPLDVTPLAMGKGDVAEGTPVRVFGAYGPYAPSFVGVDTVIISQRMAVACRPRGRELCIAGGPKGTAFGIGFTGGPVIPLDGEARLVGLVSRGGHIRRPEANGQPGVCTDVTRYRDWIATTIGDPSATRAATADSRQPHP